ncbi:MAG: low molecular weight protein-tyrosine-phosphatase [Actinomyces sp.]|nr:low molecular weight protein-tyrosine-phosphatase [Actinomyces sp.]MDO4243615.1 low molecular weight protein-tyrosine-phosphatase [Actinomyces sp.]
MVCTGNICRSAMAQIVLIDRLAGSGAGTAVRVTSAGVSAEEHGHPIDPRARQVLHAHGYGEGADEASRSVAASIRGHRASRITDSELKEADLLLAMTRAHEVELCRRLRALGSDETRVRMFRELDPQAPAQVGEGALDVQDPWYGTMSDFEDTLEVVERVCDALAPALAEVGGMTPATGEG